jgi:hypothetical protein
LTVDRDSLADLRNNLRLVTSTASLMPFSKNRATAESFSVKLAQARQRWVNFILNDASIERLLAAEAIAQAA